MRAAGLASWPTLNSPPRASFLPKTNNRVAPAMSQGSSFAKVCSGVRSSKSAPATPPMKLVINRGIIKRRGTSRRSRKAPPLKTIPVQRATVLVALAGTCGTPVNTSAGNAMKLPPPATAFMAPPSMPATKRKMAYPRCKLNVYHRAGRGKIRGDASSLANRQGAHREGGSATNRRGNGEKTKAPPVELLQSPQVFHDRDAGSEKNGVGRPCGIVHVIDVGTVDANERGSRMHQVLRGRSRKVRSGTEVVFRVPAFCPSRPQQYRLSAQRNARKHARLDRAVLRGRKYHAGEVGHTVERQVGEIEPIRITMKWRVQVGPGIASQFVGRNLETCARRIVRLFCPIAVRKEDLEFRFGQTGIGGHTRFQTMTQVDDHAHQIRLEGRRTATAGPRKAACSGTLENPRLTKILP